MKPINKHVQVQPTEDLTEKVGNVYIPVKTDGQEVGHKLIRGQVLAVANDVTCVKQGDKVVIEGYAYDYHIIEDVKCHVVHEDDIVGVFE
jgi:co-chaperonin GroES (HSP10)